MSTQDPVIIVGAGPAGLCLAYLLSRAGQSVCLVEAHNDLSRSFRGEILQQNGISGLVDIGLGDILDHVDRTLIDRLRSQLGGSSVELDLRPHDGEALAVDQPQLLEAIVQRCQTFTNFQLRLGCRVRNCIRYEGRTVGVEVEHNGQLEQLSARFVIAADGRNSRLRQLAVPSLTETVVRHDPAFDVLWVRADVGDFLDGGRLCHGEVGRGFFCIAYHAPRQVASSATYPEGRPSRVAHLAIGGPKGVFRGREREDCMAWARDQASARLREALRNTDPGTMQTTILKAVCEHLPRWSVPGLLLIGDAAHPMSPVGGQGINMAIRDAIVAYNHLAPALELEVAPEALDLAAAEVAQERLPEIATIQRLQAREGERMINLPRWMAWLAPKMLRMAPRAMILGRNRQTMIRGSSEVRLSN